MVDVNTQNKTISVNVSSSGVSSNVNASSDTTMYYSNKAREWAISNRIVDGVDYSSKYYANKSNQSALNAQSFAQSALETLNNVDNKVQEATENIEIQKQDAIAEIQDIAITQKEEIENLSEQEQDKIINLGIDTRANVDLGNLSPPGEKHFLNKSQITNCLLEAPQNIKLELADGVLTLKAGSKVIVPNGVGVFEEVAIANDMVFNNTALGNREAYIIIRTNPLDIQIPPVLSCSSGTSTPSAGWYYNTTENKIYRDGLFEGASLPIAKVTYVNGSGVVSIDETFNGMGYFGSTIFANKDIKGLIPNGRNEDGTLKNRELDSPVVRTVTALKNQTDFSLILNNDGLYILAKFNTVTTGTTPTSYGPCYVEETNKVYNNGQWRAWVHIATYSTDSTGNITSFNSKLPFHAVDYNEFNKSINTLSKAYITETYVSGTSWYRVWSDKWCEQGGIATGGASGTGNTVVFMKEYKDINYALLCSINHRMDAVFPNPAVQGVHTRNLSKTGFYASTSWCTSNNYEYTSYTFSWEAKGYIN